MSRGKIHSITVRNFVTFSEYTVEPGLYLNVVTGPNGVGKSTLVAAIILGMGGNPKLLSRASSIEDYIKNGKDEATIQLKLYTNNTDCSTFERRFNTSKKDEWKINGKVVSFKEYEKMVKTNFNIQIDNLCQFLPQDRVQDFSNQNSTELLLNTQASVCPPTMIQKFESLKELRNIELNGKKLITEYSQKLKEAETRNAELQEIINKINEKKEFMLDIDIAVSKKIWVEIAEMRERKDTTQIELDHTRSYVQRDQQAYEEIKNRTRNLIAKIETLNQNTKKSDTQVKQYAAEIEKLTESNENLSSSIRKAKNELASKKAEELERQNEELQAAQVLQVILQDMQNETAEIGPVGKFQEKLKSFDNAINDIKLKVNNLTADRRKIVQLSESEFVPEIAATHRRMESMKNVTERKLNLLKEKSIDAYTAVLWLRDNHHMFESKIYEPLILELNVKDPKYAKYFENTIQFRDLLAFTCESKNDMSLLSDKLCVEQRLKVNILHSNPAEEINFTSSDDIQHYRKFGFFAYLIDLVDGPAPILNYLCASYQLHKVLIGGDESNKYTDNLPSHFRVYFAGNQKYSITYSKYTQQPSSSRATISDKNLLSMTIDQAELTKLHKLHESKSKQLKELMNNKIEIEARCEKLEEQRTNLNSQKRVLEEKDRNLRQLKDRLAAQNRKLQQIKANNIDISQEVENFKNFANSIIKKMLDIRQRKLSALEKYQKAIEDYEYNKVIFNLVQFENAEIENQVTAAKEAYEKAKKLFDTIEGALQKISNEMKGKVNAIKKLCNGRIPSDSAFPYTSKFQSIPDDVDELTDHISELQARVECMTTENQSVIEEHEEKSLRIQELKKLIKDTVTKGKNVDEQMKTLHNEWYPKISEVVSEINKFFGGFMKEMGYVGQVELIHEEIHNYNSYGIQILVQYRNNEKLEPLTRSRQSGGERAVAIAVYTLSLQHLTDVPFRCVDEINQGMDPRNERKIFQMLVSETSRENKSQYFYITPKLLSGLLDNYEKPLDKLTWLIVYQAKYD